MPTGLGEELDPGKGDRVAEFLIGLRGVWIVVAAASGVLLSLVPILVSALEGNFRNPALKLDSSRDWGYYIQLCAGIPAAMILFSLYFGFLPATLRHLSSSAVLRVGSTDYSDFVEKANREFRSPLVVLVPWAIGLLIAAVGLHSYILGRSGTWNSNLRAPNGTVAGWTSVPVVIFLYYLLGLIIVRIIVTYRLLRAFFRRFKLEPQPLHPDGCGGLAALGDLAIKLNIGTSMFGIIVGLGVYSSIVTVGLAWYHPVHFLMVLGYVAAASCMFFLPMRPAHEGMKRVKREVLHDIHDRFAEVNTRILGHLSSGSPISADDMDEFSRLRELHSMAKSMPVFPFDTRTVRAFVTSIVTPVLLVVLQIVLTRLL